MIITWYDPKRETPDRNPGLITHCSDCTYSHVSQPDNKYSVFLRITKGLHRYYTVTYPQLNQHFSAYSARINVVFLSETIILEGLQPKGGSFVVVVRGFLSAVGSCVAGERCEMGPLGKGCERAR